MWTRPCAGPGGTSPPRPRPAWRPPGPPGLRAGAGGDGPGGGPRPWWWPGWRPGRAASAARRAPPARAGPRRRRPGPDRTGSGPAGRSLRGRYRSPLWSPHTGPQAGTAPGWVDGLVTPGEGGIGVNREEWATDHPL